MPPIFLVSIVFHCVPLYDLLGMLLIDVPRAKLCDQGALHFCYLVLAYANFAQGRPHAAQEERGVAAWDLSAQQDSIGAM